MVRSAPDPEVARLAEVLRGRLDALVDELTALIGQEIDIYGAGGMVDSSELRRSVQHNFTYMLGQLATAEPADLTAPRHTGRRRAEASAPLPEILRAYRLGFAFLWEALLAEARRSGEAATRALVDTAAIVWSLADDYSQALTESYREAVAEAMQAADRHRSAVVQALVTGEVSAEATVWEIAKVLGMPFEGTFLVVVAESAAIGGEPLAGVESRLRAFDATSAWRLQPDFEVGVISCGRTNPDKILDVLGVAAPGRVGVSPPYPTLDKTTHAMRLAQVAMESLPAGQPAVRQFEDTPLGSLVAADPDAARLLVERVLGRLITLPDEERTTLLSTVEAWLDARGSAAEAGRVLYCHPNTVRYRLHRIEEHTGRSLDDPRAVAELTTALHALRIFPGLLAGPAG